MTALSLYEWNLVCPVLQRLDIGRIYGLIAQNLEVDWSAQIAWKRKGAGKHKYSLVQQHQSWQKLQLLSFLIPLVEAVHFHKTE